MHALSIHKPPQTQEQPPAKVSAAALLGSATKKSSKSSSHLAYTGPAALQAAARWLETNAKAEEAERELALLRDEILKDVRIWHADACARLRRHESTVELTTTAGKVRVSFQHRYSKIPLESETALREAVGDEFEKYFKRSVALKVKKEVAEDPERLEQLVIALAESIGADNFASLFEVEQTLAPTKAFTESSCQLPAATREALGSAGVKQIVAMTAA